MSPFGLSPGYRHWLREGSEYFGAPNIEKSIFDVKPREAVPRYLPQLNAELHAEETGYGPFHHVTVKIPLEDHFKGNPRRTQIFIRPRPNFV